MRTFFYSIIFFLCTFFVGQAQIFLPTKSDTLLDIGLQVELLEDKTQKLELAQILALVQDTTKSNTQFRLSTQQIPNFGNTTSAIWGKFTIKTSQPAEWYLEIATPLLSHIEFYKPVGNSYQRVITGAAYPFAQREELIPNYLFKVTQLQDSIGTKNFYFKIQSEYPLEIPLRIGKLKTFLIENHHKDIWYGLYGGIMMSMMLYNFFLFITVKERLYLYYMSYVFLVAGLYLNLKGYLFELFFYDMPSFNSWISSHSSLTMICVMLFARNFLRTSQYTPKLNRGISIYIVLCLLNILYNLINPSHFIFHHSLSQLLATVGMLYLLVIGIVNVWQKNPTAIYFLVAWLIFILSVVILMSKLLSILPINAFTDNAVFFGSATEVLLLSLALGNRINTLKKEKQKAQAESLKQALENEKLVKEQNAMLEQKVTEKTMALKEALEEVKQTNEELSVTLETLENKNKAINEQRQLIEKSFQDLEFLSDIGKEISRSLDIRRIIGTVYRYVNSFMDSDGFGIGLYHEQTNSLDFDGYIENGQELPFSSDNIANKELLSVVCFCNSQNIIINDMHAEYKQYVEKIIIHVGVSVHSLIYLPLVTQGKTIGVITVQSFKVNAYSDYHVTMLQNIANYAATALENAEAYKFIQQQQQEITKKNHDILASIQYAKRIQRALLPLKSNLDDRFGEDNYFILFKPRDVVSGDFYWFTDKENKGISLVVVADCTGHGVPGALLTMIGYQLLDRIVNENNLLNPAKILQILHFELLKTLQQKNTDIKDGMDICVIAIHKKQKKAEYAGAMNPIYYFQNGELKEIKATKMPIGSATKEAERKFDLHTIDLDTTTTFYLCTDGYQDQFGGEKNKKFMVGGLKKLLLQIHEEPMPQQKLILDETIENWRATAKEPQIDDITILGLRT